MAPKGLMSEAPEQPRLILASASPRRQSLLREAGYSFEVIPADIDEENYPPGILPSELAMLLARQKAEAISRKHPSAVVLGADTVVALGDQIIGKPTDAGDARQILELLAGTTHIVITGLAVVRAVPAFSRVLRVMSAVRMRHLSARDLDRYIAGGEWAGKAGAYGIQDADPFVTRMSGSHSNIVGLPMNLARQLLMEAGARSDKMQR